MAAVSDFIIRPLRDSEASQVAAWAYEPPFNIYDGDPAHPEGYLALDADGFGYYAVARRTDDEVVGFCCFGSEARVKGQEPQEGVLDVGGGVRPDLVSQGLATQVFPLVLAFAQERFSPQRFRTAVATF